MHLALAHSIKCSLVKTPELIDDSVVYSKFVDAAPYGFVEFHIHVGVIDTTLDVNVVEDNAPDGSDDPTVVSDWAIEQLTGASEDEVMLIITMPKEALTKRYVGLKFDPGDGDAGCLISAEAFRWQKTGMLPESQEDGNDDPYPTSQFWKLRGNGYADPIS